MPVKRQYSWHWLIRANTGLGPCYEASDLDTESAETISHFFPHLVSKFPVAVITKKESRLDQGEEGQGIVFLVSYLWPGVFRHRW